LTWVDAANKRVLSVDKAANDVHIFCVDQRMLQPNDLALSTMRDTLIFLSGQNFTADTAAGVSGDLWTCDGGEAIQFPPSILAAAGIHRTNGIETSPDGKFLYLSSAKNVASKVVLNQLFKFELNPNTGGLLEQPPTLFFDFTDSEATDIDGMRTDTDGNLFVTRNGNGNAVKISSDGKLQLTIEFPNMGGPSNLEFGGPKGSTLFAIGKCASNNTIGCAASFDTDSVGKAFAALQKSS
jgi:sugar lactone lactonase YvrE